MSEVVDLLFLQSLHSGESDVSYGVAVASGKTGKLVRGTVASTVACKWEFCTYNFDPNGTLRIAWDTIYTNGWDKPTAYWQPPSKDYITRAGPSAGFCVKVTNLDNSRAADAHCTLYWLEE
jgi:hypothetical protein